jgi:hypothetical protein
METFCRILIYLAALAIGFSVQYLIRWSPRVNTVLSFLTVMLVPPFWSLGLIGGFWISSAFFTFKPESDNQHRGALPIMTWQKVCLYSAWTFLGFLLTLVFLWKLKITNSLLIDQREVLAWLFLVLVEVCIFKIIAKMSPGLYRIPMGYGMAFLNFLMVLHWLFPLGPYRIGLILVSFLVINPLLLSLVDLPLYATGTSFSGVNR